MRESGNKTRDKGIAQVLMLRLESQRLPRALKLKEKVDRGERLSDFDLQFLKRAMQEGQQARTLAAKMPEYQEVVNRVAALYDEITRKGAENEKKAAPGK